jgi:mono/diheme cytochrome c family protein
MDDGFTLCVAIAGRIHIRAACFWLLLLCASFTAHDTLGADIRQGVESSVYPQTTYQKFLRYAESGDPEIQNFIGYMLFYGEGVKQDYHAAHSWFHLAAEQNHKGAQRNLGLFHARVQEESPVSYLDLNEANFWFQRYEAKQRGNGSVEFASWQMSPWLNESDLTGLGPFEIGRQSYLYHCSGCHGEKGMAAYDLSPSFGLGERLYKSDEELLTNVMDGFGSMPGWRNLLSEETIIHTLSYIRTLSDPESLTLGEATISQFQSETFRAGDGLYTMFCAGCHGFVGISYYVNSPSFALGERMHKSDAELMRSIQKGIGQMPSWEDKLSYNQLWAILGSIRSRQSRFMDGIEHPLPETPRVFFRFRPRGERSDDWRGADPRGIPP